jgi:hypothetical protein
VLGALLLLAAGLTYLALNLDGLASTGWRAFQLQVARFVRGWRAEDVLQMALAGVELAIMGLLFTGVILTLVDLVQRVHDRLRRRLRRRAAPAGASGPA